jgi:hypothetical protein
VSNAQLEDVSGAVAGRVEQVPAWQTSVPGHSLSNVHELILENREHLPKLQLRLVHSESKLHVCSSALAVAPADADCKVWSSSVERCSLPSELSHSLWLLCMHPIARSANEKTMKGGRMPLHGASAVPGTKHAISRIRARGVVARTASDVNRERQRKARLKRYFDVDRTEDGVVQ